jgi:hypothetical protein
MVTRTKVISNVSKERLITEIRISSSAFIYNIFAVGCNTNSTSVWKVSQYKYKINNKLTNHRPEVNGTINQQKQFNLAWDLYRNTALMERAN